MAEPNERLRLLTQTGDGFVIAQKDMEIRGPGELFGYRQSGPVSAGLGALSGNSELLKLSHDEARALLRDSGSPEAQAVIRLAESAFAEKLEGIGVN